MFVPQDTNATQIGVYHLARNPQLYTPHENNNFMFIVTNIDGLRRAGVQGTEESAYFQNAQEVLKLSVDSAAVPHFSQAILSIAHGNNTMKFAGKPNIPEGESFVFNDYVGAETKSILIAWQNLSYNVYNEKVGSLDNPETQYKKDAYLVEYTPDYRQINRWIMHGCWINDLTFTNFDYNGNEVCKCTAAITYDWAELDVSDLV